MNQLLSEHDTTIITKDDTEAVVIAHRSVPKKLHKWGDFREFGHILRKMYKFTGYSNVARSVLEDLCRKELMEKRQKLGTAIWCYRLTPKGHRQLSHYKSRGDKNRSDKAQRRSKNLRKDARRRQVKNGF